MPNLTSQRLLSACHGHERVTIGWDAPDLLRRLSDARKLTCPGCGATVVLHAGVVRAHHFAHLQGAVCTLPQTEPETEEHRGGKLLLAKWLRQRVEGAQVTVEAYLPETQQRADLLLEAARPGCPRCVVAVEFQCANLSAREWRRRHALYRDAGITDLWILGASRCHAERLPDPGRDGAQKGSGSQHRRVLRASELERVLIAEGLPLLFLDPAGHRFSEGDLARFRPAADAQLLRPTGRLSVRPLLDLEFPWALLEQAVASPIRIDARHRVDPPPSETRGRASGQRLWMWLEQRYHITPATLSSLFGITVVGQEAILCEARLWQAALYYRFIHRRVGAGWWLAEVETWARAYLPLANPLSVRRLRSALRSTQDFFAAAGLLTLPTGYSRSSARVAADLETLPSPPDREEAVRIARYRRLVDR